MSVEVGEIYTYVELVRHQHRCQSQEVLGESRINCQSKEELLVPIKESEQRLTSLGFSPEQISRFRCMA